MSRAVAPRSMPAPLRPTSGLARRMLLPASGRRLVAAVVLGIAALLAVTAVLTTVGFGIRGLTIAAFSFLLVLLAVVVAGRLASALVVTVAAIVLLAYEFVPPYHSLDFADKRVVTAVVMFVVAAIVVAVLVAAQATAREAADAARERIAFLAAAGELLSSSLDHDEILTRLVELVVPGLADWCSIDLVDEGAIRQVRIAHADPGRHELLTQLRRRLPPALDATSGSGAVIRSGRTQFLADIPPELVQSIEDAEGRALLDQLGLRSAITAPLTAQGRPLGALTLVYAESGRRYTDADRELAEELARRAALAIDNSRLYRQQQHVAHTLQQALLPRELPPVPGLVVATRYAAAAEGSEVGGDFYDLWRMGGSGFGLMIGDVCGKGPEAAALTGLTRHTVLTASLVSSDPSPRHVLEVTNGAILRSLGGERFCTLVYAHGTQAADGFQLVLASAGHPPPALVRGGEVSQLEGTGTLLGIVPTITVAEHRLDLRPGDRLVLWTDGVTERRRDGELFGEERLFDLLRSLALEPAESIADAIVEAVAAFDESDPSDDVALLVLELPAQERGDGPGSTSP
jgi:serine phosphatase RsbU (regulator of sigma subunit)